MMIPRVSPLLAWVALALWAATASAHGPTVQVSEGGLDPAELEIARGETVHFVNRGAKERRLVGDAFQSPALPPGGDGWHQRFPFPGRFPYALEDAPEVRGAIVVRDAE